MSQEAIKAARELFNAMSSGVLSTLSVRLDGFPFGSVVPYSLDDQGLAVILVSTIAQHTKNIIADNRCSITIVNDEDDVQANGRLCIIGNMEKVADHEITVKERYYRSFPKSKSYHETHDFHFYRLNPIDIRYIGGFGAIHWLNPKDFQVSNPFQGKEEDYIINHMNSDHQKDLNFYCSHFKQIEISEEESVRMTGIDSLGFDLFVGDKKIRFSFDEPISTTQEARAKLVALTKGDL